MASTNLAFTHAQRACQALQKMVPRLVNAAVVIHNEPILHCEPASVPVAGLYGEKPKPRIRMRHACTYTHEAASAPL